MRLEMGITNLVDGRTNFAQLMRATKVPRGGPITSSVQAGSALCDQIQCNVCHTRNIITSPVGNVINAGQLTVPAALGNKIIHLFGDFMLHNIGTGDGIVPNGGAATCNMVHTAPLWGVRTRNRLMHDGEGLTFTETILRHAGQATSSANGATSTQHRRTSSSISSSPSDRERTSLPYRPVAGGEACGRPSSLESTMAPLLVSAETSFHMKTKMEV